MKIRISKKYVLNVSKLLKNLATFFGVLLFVALFLLWFFQGLETEMNLIEMYGYC